MRWKCNTCGYEYDDTMPDGMLYFHVCLPIIDPETWEFKERPNARNENIVEDRKTGRVWIKSEGECRIPVKKPPDKRGGLDHARNP